MSEKLIVGVYHALDAAEEAIAALDRHGFPVAHVSVVAENFTDDGQTSAHLSQTAHRTDDLKEWFARRFKWILSLPHFAAYEKHFHARKYLLVAHGTEDQIAWAWAIIRETGCVEADVHDELESDL